MNKYKEFTLNTWKKWDLIKYVKQLEEINEKYDVKLNKQYKAINEVNEYINKCLNTKRKLYLDAVLITIQNILGSEDNENDNTSNRTNN